MNKDADTTLSYSPPWNRLTRESVCDTVKISLPIDIQARNIKQTRDMSSQILMHANKLFQKWDILFFEYFSSEHFSEIFFISFLFPRSSNRHGNSSFRHSPYRLPAFLFKRFYIDWLQEKKNSFSFLNKMAWFSVDTSATNHRDKTLAGGISSGGIFKSVPGW